MELGRGAASSRFPYNEPASQLKPSVFVVNVLIVIVVLDLFDICEG
jgi:hypothetical protein